MASVQRSTAARWDSTGRSAVLPSTGLFTTVDKEPDIGSPPESTKKKEPFESASRLGGRGFASVECPRATVGKQRERNLAKGPKIDQARSEKWLDRRGIAPGAERKGCKWK